MKITEGGTAIFRCPVDTANSCLIEAVEWFRISKDGSQDRLKNSRVEVFSFDPLLM